MKIAKLIVCAVALAPAGCKPGLAGHHVDKLDFKTFSVAVPAGWNQITDPGMVAKAGPDGRIMVPAELPAGFAPSVVIQEMASPPAFLSALYAATADLCTNQIQAPLVAETKTTAGPSKVTTVGALRGCDIEIIDPNGHQATRQLTLTDGHFAVSLVCNRDKAGAPAIDAACEAMAKSITAK